jgi:hypothetical protein
MSISAQRITAYCLLAQINNQSSSLRNIADVFLPLVKRALASLSSDGNTGGEIPEIKARFDLLYGLDIPYPVLKPILKRIEGEKGTEGNFKLHRNDNSFLLSNYVFTDFEEEVERREQSLRRLHDKYEKFLDAKGINPSSELDIFKFVEANRLALATFFGRKSDSDQSNSLGLQAEFLNEIKGITEDFELIRSIYLGSVIAAYLDLNLTETTKLDFELVIDTNVVVSLLELGSAESIHTCAKLIELTKQMGCTITVLDETVREIQALLRRKAQDHEGLAWESIDPESIFASFLRLKLTKTDIERIAVGLERRLVEMGIRIIHVPQSVINDAKFSREFAKLQGRDNNPEGALHDAIAIQYVKYRRTKPVYEFSKSKCWFVTNPRYRFYVLQEIDGLPQTASVLWLASPGVRGQELIDLSLTRQITVAMHHRFPSAQLLRQFGDNVQKYAPSVIENEDFIYLTRNLFHRERSEIEALVAVAHKEPKAFNEQVTELVKEAKLEEEAREEQRRKEMDAIRTESESKISQAQHEAVLREQSEIQKQRMEWLHLTSSQLSEQRRRQALSDVEILKPIVEKQQQTLIEIDKSANLFGRSGQLACGLAWLIVLAALYLLFGSTFSGAVASGFLGLIVWGLLAILDKDLRTPKEIKAKLTTHRRQSLLLKYGLNAQELGLLERRLSDSQDYLQSINSGGELPSLITEGLAETQNAS